MGNTWKDQRKWERKQREKEEPSRTPKPRKNRRHYDEIIPEGDSLDPYEALDYIDDYER